MGATITTALPPPYPIINDNPTNKEVISNIRNREWGLVGSFFFLGFICGFSGGTIVISKNAVFNSPVLVGRPHRKRNGWTMAVLFTYGSFLVMGRRSMTRLLGFRENKEECARFGIPWLPPDEGLEELYA